MQKLTPADLDALEAAHKAATPGEWKIGLSKNGRWQVSAKGMQVCWVWGTTARPAKELGAAICDAHNALPALLEAARAGVPEEIGEKHKKGDYWQVWVPKHKQWVKCRWYADTFWLVFGGFALDGTPTHALPMPPAPEGSDA
jgi:hypothetical protein